jgi:hypothetical protein
MGDIDEDERGLSLHDKALARQIAKEQWRLLSYEVGKSILSKVIWTIIMVALGFGGSYFLKR